ncbi:uncharacterized protein LOC144110775 isoform X1 [Amblyomma americanum]
MADKDKKDEAKEAPKDEAKDKKEDVKKEGEKKPEDSNVDKDFVIFHFPGVEQPDGTSAGCETLKIPRQAAIGMVQKVRPAVARLVERCPCNDPEPEAPEPVIPCVDCMAELKEEARRLSTRAVVKTPVSNMSIQQPCPFKAQSLTLTQSCPVPPQAPPLPETITQQMSFIKISCGKCGAEQVADPNQTASRPPAPGTPGALQPGVASTSGGPCAGPGMMNVAKSIPGSDTHIQFVCNCLEKFQPGGAGGGYGAPLPPIPHAPNCCYARGFPPPGTSEAPRRGHSERVRDRLISEERRMMSRFESEDDYAGGSGAGRPGSRRYQELEERRTYAPNRASSGGGGRSGRSPPREYEFRGRLEETSEISEGDEGGNGPYVLRRTSSGSVEVIGDDNYNVRVSLADGVTGARSRRRRYGR